MPLVSDKMSRGIGTSLLALLHFPSVKFALVICSGIVCLCRAMYCYHSYFFCDEMLLKFL